jgi:hypothetical protein
METRADDLVPGRSRPSCDSGHATGIPTGNIRPSQGDDARQLGAFVSIRAGTIFLDSHPMQSLVICSIVEVLVPSTRLMPGVAAGGNTRCCRRRLPAQTSNSRLTLVVPMITRVFTAGCLPNLVSGKTGKGWPDTDTHLRCTLPPASARP